MPVPGGEAACRLLASQVLRTSHYIKDSGPPPPVPSLFPRLWLCDNPRTNESVSQGFFWPLSSVKRETGKKRRLFLLPFSVPRQPTLPLAWLRHPPHQHSATNHQKHVARRRPLTTLPKYLNKVPNQVTSSRKICPSLAAVAGLALPCSTTTCHHPPLLTSPVSAGRPTFYFIFSLFNPIRLHTHIFLSILIRLTLALALRRPCPAA